MATTQYYGTGRRKTSTARVFLRPGSGTITVNERPLEASFPTETLRLIIRQPLVVTETGERFDVLATTAGGGVAGQAGALRLGIARALLEFNAELRSTPAQGRAADARPARQGTQEVRHGGRAQALPVQQALRSGDRPCPARGDESA